MADKGKAFLVEIDSEGLAWVKSSASTNGPNCVELAHTDDRIIVRCSRARAGARLEWPTVEWNRFVVWVRQR